MQRRILYVAATALMGLAFATSAAPMSGAAQVDRVNTTSDRPSAPAVQMLDCRGSTGSFGCGPGWFWRDGWRGMACYPC